MSEEVGCQVSFLSRYCCVESLAPGAKDAKGGGDFCIMKGWVVGRRSSWVVPANHFLNKVSISHLGFQRGDTLLYGL